MNYEPTSDLIERFLDTTRPDTYVVLKASSLAEAYAWLEITSPNMIHGVLLGLSARENAVFVQQLAQAGQRENYVIAVMDFPCLACIQQEQLRVDTILAQPFTIDKLMETMDYFAEREIHRQHQLV